MRFFILVCLSIITFQIQAQSDASTCYVFGHSLIDHRPPIKPTPSDETTVPHWLQLLANHANKDFALAGKYGFLPQHATQPVFSQWGYDIVNPAWDSDYETFAEADFSTIMITAGNFIQWQPHTEEYYGDPGITPLSAMLDVIDFVAAQGDSMKIIIYENWPDMGVIAPDFPPTADQLETYYDYTEKEFNDWWVAYHNDVDANRPLLNVKMVPVGPIFAELFRNTALKDIPVLDLYEDNAPHGRPSIYFLASLASYIAIYEEKPPADFEVPSIVHELIAENYEMIVDKMWEMCEAFNFEDGRNRVFTQKGVSGLVAVEERELVVYPNPAIDEIRIDGVEEGDYVEIVDGMGMKREEMIGEGGRIGMGRYPAGIYYIRLINPSGEGRGKGVFVKM